MRTEQKQDLLGLLCCLWPSLNAVFQTAQPPNLFFKWFCWRECFPGSCADFSIDVWGLFLSSKFVFCSIKCHHFLGLHSRCLVLACCQFFFTSIWALRLDNLQHLLPSFVLVPYELASAFISFSSFLSVFQAWYLKRKENNLLASSPDHSAEQFFKSGHICPTICLEVVLYPEVLAMRADVTLST